MPLTVRDTTLRALAILGFAIAALITVLAVILSLACAGEPLPGASRDLTPSARFL